jgi:hypothetical protein
VRTQNVQIVTNGDLSAASVTSSVVLLENIAGYTVQCILTGSPVGVLKLQLSCDFGTDLAGTGVANWTDLTGYTANITAASGVAFNADFSNYRWVRLVYTRTSGTGSLNARINIKGV